MATIWLDDDFQKRIVGQIVSLDSSWTNDGYTEVLNPPNLSIVARSSMPAGLLADPNFPLGKNKLLRGLQSAAEAEAHLVWEFADSSGHTQGVRSAYLSWWEYRANANRAGEKLCRLGNRIGYPLGNRLLDIIVYFAQNGQMGVIANSTQMNDFGDQPICASNAWTGKLSHWEVNVNLSTGINADGSVSVWQDGALLGTASGLRMFLNTADAATNLELFEIGGWNSGSGTFQTWPIDRNFAQWRVADYRLGVWPITSPSIVAMTNIAYISALQAPVVLTNPTGSLGLVGTQLGAAGQASIQPGQGVLALVSTPPMFAFGMATQPGALATTGATAGCISGIVTPRVPAGAAVGLSGSAASVTLSAGTTAIKFHPSVAYWQMDYNTLYSTQIARFAVLKSKCPQTQGFEVFLPWSDLENPALVGGSAQYDGSWAAGDQTNVNNQKGFKLVDSLINAAATLGCQLMLSIHSIGGHSNGGDVSASSFPSNFMPTYLSGAAYGPNTAASNGVWGGVWLNSYAGNGVQFTMYIRYWVQAVADRLNLLGAAYGSRYDTNANLETVGFAADEMVISQNTTCTDAGQLATLTGPNGLMASWRASWPRTQLRLWANYFQTIATMDTFLAEAVNNRRWSVGGPDTCNDAPVVSSDPALNSDGQYRSVAAAYRWVGWTAAGGDGGSRDLSLPNYAGVGHCICEVEAEDTAYDAVSGTTIGNSRHLGDGILPHIVNQANRLGCTHMVWFDNTFSGRPQVQTNTAHPNLCDFISSVAQGGNVAVNGITAGITLANKTYPPSFP